MNSKFTGLFAFLLIILLVWLNFNFDQPEFQPDNDRSESQFSTSRAFSHVEELSKEPHYVGSAAHSRARNYIVQELQQMGLQVQTQEGYSLNASGVITRPQNILARIEGSGNGNALVLMSHYDSAMHSSYGASDAASGVATILEGIRAFLNRNLEHTNDIIILFTDAEELGLNGADLFVKDHPWAKDAKLALNFEARGSGGNSFMLLETNQKNARMIEAFERSGVSHPVTNSLAYSIYKMLPNDTDLTVLRESGNINGYNFAFIDDHFDYHTATDLASNLDMETLAHQGSYLMPMLEHFSNANLEELDSDRDLIYFSFPFGEFVSYPFDWVNPMFLAALVVFMILLVYGFKKERLQAGGLFFGFLPLLLSLVTSGLLGWAFWQFCLFIYPEYSEMEQGFTYNGYWYIAASIFLSLSLCFFFYHLFRKNSKGPSAFVAPLSLWLFICGVIAFYLKGASYFIIPVYFGLLQLFVMIRQKNPNRILMCLLSAPAIFLILPFIWSLPVALGLKNLFITAILVSLLFAFFIPVFTYFRRLKSFAFLSFLTFNVLVFTAHFYSDFNTERPKPNSLVYLKNLDDNSTNWYSYDAIPDAWTKEYFGKDPELRSNGEISFDSKYGSSFSFRASAPDIQIPEPAILLEKTSGDSLENRVYSLKIAPRRDINRIELYETRGVDFSHFKVNGLEAPAVFLGENSFHMFKRRWKERLLTYYAANSDTLRIEFGIKKGDSPEFILYESAYDLIGNEKLNVEPRPAGMIPRPFVLTDVTILKKSFKLNE